MTDITPGKDFHDDIRPADIVMALGGCWVLLGVLVYLAVVALTAPPPHADTVTLAPSEVSLQANVPAAEK